MADRSIPCENPACWNSAVNGFACQKCWDALPDRIKAIPAGWAKNNDGLVNPTVNQLSTFTDAALHAWRWKID